MFCVEAILMRTHNIPSYLEQIFIVPKVFEPLKFDCISLFLDCTLFSDVLVSVK